MIKQQFFPGWKATVSGQDSPIYRVNYLFQAIPIPAGSSTVVLKYQPRSLGLGALLSMVAMIALFIVYRRARPADSGITYS
jgi:uncharacterized membrane protein YfhO